MIALFFSFVAFILLLYGAFLFLCIFLGIIRGLPSIGKGLAARWSDNPVKDVKAYRWSDSHPLEPARNTLNYDNFKRTK